MNKPLHFCTPAVGLTDRPTPKLSRRPAGAKRRQGCRLERLVSRDTPSGACGFTVEQTSSHQNFDE